MRVSLNWLQDYIDTSDLRPEELADKLDLTGTAVENVFKEGAGLELEITPNRPDQMSMIGMAREIGAILNRDYKIPPINIKEALKKASEVAEATIEDEQLCPRYIAKIITDVTVGESPDWMKKRLLAAGAKPINNLVDITNYILFETGQPLHAFDYELLEGGQIIVRRAKAGEKMTTLDDIERLLNKEHLVIADKKGAVALAGVMGGANSEVNVQTKTVLLESAYFNLYNIGQTSRSLGLISESSIRFERGVDPNNTAYAADRAAQLMQELAGGTVLKGSVDIYPKPFKLRKLKLRPSRANSILGVELPAKKMRETLISLEIEAVLNPPKPPFNKRGQGGLIEVGVPTFRPDLEREIDLIEEIGRLYGLNNIESTLPGVAQVGRVTDMDLLQTKLRGLLTGYGLKEAITYSFIDPIILKDLPPKQQKAVQLSNPLSTEQSVLRTVLLPGLLNSLKYNVARQQVDVQLFEMGSIFRPKNGFLEEKRHLGLILSGKKVDFFNAKGIVESILRSLLISEELVLEPFEHKLFNPQKSFKLLLGESELGYIGELHPNYAQAHDLLTTAYAALDLDILLKHQNTIAPFKGISAYPAITLDVALLLDNKVKHAEVVRSIEEKGHDLLADISLFDIYEGKGIEAGKKSMAYSLTYQSMERTLELDEIQKIHNSILDNLKKDLNAIIR